MATYNKNENYYRDSPKYKESWCPKCSSDTWQKILTHNKGECQKCGKTVS